MHFYTLFGILKKERGAYTSVQNINKKGKSILIKTSALTLFTAKEVDYENGRTVFECDLRILREMSEAQLQCFYETAHPTQRDQLVQFIAQLRDPQHRHVLCLRFTLRHASFAWCGPLDDAQMLIAFMHQYNGQAQGSH